MQTSQTLTLLAGALAKAQGELTDAAKESVNPQYKSRYADLASVLQAVRPVLSRHGLSVTQGLSLTPDGVMVTSRLLHKDGEWIEDALVVPLSRRDAQGVGAAATYGRRYALAALVGISQEDDDGNTASGVGPGGRTPPAPAAPKKGREASDADIADLVARFGLAKSKDDIVALIDAFVRLPPEQQAAVLPAAQKARERVGL